MIGEDPDTGFRQTKVCCYQWYMDFSALSAGTASVKINVVFAVI